MVSQEYHLLANEDLYIFLTSKLITSFIDGFTSRNIILLNCSFIKSNFK